MPAVASPALVRTLRGPVRRRVECSWAHRRPRHRHPTDGHPPVWPAARGGGGGPRSGEWALARGARLLGLGGRAERTFRRNHPRRV